MPIMDGASLLGSSMACLFEETSMALRRPTLGRSRNRKDLHLASARALQDICEPSSQYEQAARVTGRPLKLFCSLSHARLLCLKVCCEIDKLGMYVMAGTLVPAITGGHFTGKRSPTITVQFLSPSQAALAMSI